MDLSILFEKILLMMMHLKCNFEQRKKGACHTPVVIVCTGGWTQCAHKERPKHTPKGEASFLPTQSYCFPVWCPLEYPDTSSNLTSICNTDRVIEGSQHNYSYIKKYCLWKSRLRLSFVVQNSNMPKIKKGIANSSIKIFQSV